ncbi:hypothetical protein W97_04794 [Coniosporium apollinis CBS 100218]|uniref:Uncharacterized protein n=1 Tax=Coniosporium apollinis (strain CBS 100218) TaxID=1168221 RepID=R7YV70_CONA1|nr:uncharacterized protein W97_04794 [Coniosporium apollinis CBS 100218]EON65556.1 hypothetical protein W97_04794 [Coniosporium apollinis CBS 100218]
MASITGRRGESSTQSSNPAQARFAQSSPANDDPAQGSQDADKPKKKKHRAGKKHRRNRRQSFAAPSEDQTDNGDVEEGRPSLVEARQPSDHRQSFYRLGQANRSNTSLESEALLDHRNHSTLQARRQSIHPGPFQPPGGQQYKHRQSNVFGASRSKLSKIQKSSDRESEEEGNTDDRTPLIPPSQQNSPTSRNRGYGGFLGPSSGGQRPRRRSTGSSHSHRSRDKRTILDPPEPPRESFPEYDVNNPPSVPVSPRMGAEMPYEDVMLMGDLERETSRESRGSRLLSGDALIDIDGDGSEASPKSKPDDMRRRMTMSAEDDVCFPQDVMSETAHDDDEMHEEPRRRSRHSRRRRWPELSVLDDYARQEKKERTMEGLRARKVSEPLMVGGRLRPQKRLWHREDDDAPYRFTYFNEEFESTIHSQTISELVQPGQTFRDLFLPDPPLLEDESSSEEEDESHPQPTQHHMPPSDRKTDTSNNGASGSASRQPSMISMRDHKPQHHPSSGEQTGSNSPGGSRTPKGQGQKRYGPRPVFWLDVLSPTDAEMRVISKAFGIHALTAEDIMMQEAREKVELFKNYYFVNYRTFEQDTNSENFLDPVNMYVVVFGEGVISFHFSMTPHPANVRRRIRQLSDYLILSSDWISYAIIDDITDVYAPLIERIEDEVDEIDDAILGLHSPEDNSDNAAKKMAKAKELEYEKQSEAGDASGGDSGGDMLRRVGECRKKVMSLYRLLGNKADVIKGFAKRCNEQWEVAPRSEIGLYLGDIQDHIVTMTANLSHYENLLSRAHSNYLAQINIRMNERQEQTADVLGKLTVLGTIVLPMNIVTGMWGMNVLVPGQNVDSLWWFSGITGGLLIFGLTSYFIAKRVYGIV